MYSHDKSGHVTAMNATLRMRTHHYTTFSIVHSNGKYDNGTVIDEWEKSELEESVVNDHTLPISKGYFDGPTPISFFQYLQGMSSTHDR